MKEYLEYLKNPFIAGFVFGILIVLFAYFDKFMNERDFENNYFIKLFISVFILVSGLVYLVRLPDINYKKMSGGSINNIDNVGIKVIKDYGNNGLDVFTDIPDF